MATENPNQLAERVFLRISPGLRQAITLESHGPRDFSATLRVLLYEALENRGYRFDGDTLVGIPPHRQG